MKNSKLLLGVSAVVLSAMPLWVQAQTAAAGVQLEEIIVTAERREADLQKTAIAITALDANTLTSAGVTQGEDLNKLVPGLHIAQGGPSTQIYVRGVGNYSTNAFADAAVAFNLDGVYIGRFTGVGGNFFDVSRVEVLKGPQGTLYGRNATGGALNIISNKPTQEFAGSVGVDGGSYSLLKVNGMLNAPITDTLAMRVAFQTTNRDGYQTDGNDDDVSRSARLHLLFKPSDDLSLLLTGSYLHLGGKGPAQVPYTNNGFVDNNNPWLGQSVSLPISLAALPNAAIFTGVDRTQNNQDVTVKGFTAELNTKLGAASLAVIGNHTSNVNPSRFFGPGFMVATNDREKQDSLEVRLSGDTGPVQWVGGVYYYKEKQSTIYWVDQGHIFNQTGLNVPDITDTSYAGFGQVTYSLTDRVRLTGGVRYTNEKKTQDGEIYFRGAASLCSQLGSGLPTVTIDQIIPAIPQAAITGASTSTWCRDTTNGSRTWNNVSWKAGVDFDVSTASMMYFNVSRGFKAGGFFAAGNTSITGNSFDPETLTAYAFGSKNRFMNNRLQVNGEAFYWDYKDHQENYLAPTSTLGSFNFVTQKASAHIYGIDLDIDALVTDNDQLSVKLSYLHAEYTDANFINASPGPGNPSPRSTCIMTQDAAPAIWHADCNGQQMPRSPTLSGNLDYHHTFALANGGSIVPGIEASYSASYWSAVDYNPLQKQDAYTMWGADLSYKAPSDKWTLTAYGANLSNEVVFSNAFMYPGTNSVTNGGAGNIATVRLLAPRTYGVRIGAKF